MPSSPMAAESGAPRMPAIPPKTCGSMGAPANRAANAESPFVASYKVSMRELRTVPVLPAMANVRSSKTRTSKLDESHLASYSAAAPASATHGPDRLSRRSRRLLLRPCHRS